MTSGPTFLSWVRLAHWDLRLSILVASLLLIAIFLLTALIRPFVKRKGFGWMSFLPTIVPAVPTLLLLYQLIRSRMLHGPCLPEDGCMDEASGFIVIGAFSTALVFCFCLGFELLVRDARKRKEILAAGPALIVPPTTANPVGWFRRIVLPVVGFVVSAVPAGFVAIALQTQLAGWLVYLVRWLLPNANAKLAMLAVAAGFFALANIPIQRSLARPLVKVIAAMVLLAAITYAGRWGLRTDSSEYYLSFLLLTAGVTTAVLVRFKKTWLFYGLPLYAFVTGIVLGNLF